MGLNHSNQKIVAYVGFDALEDFVFYDYILYLDSLRRDSLFVHEEHKVGVEAGSYLVIRPFSSIFCLGCKMELSIQIRNEKEKKNERKRDSRLTENPCN